MLLKLGYKIINKMENTFGFHGFPDRLYLKAVYYLSIGQKLNLKNPRRFTEKLQWLKLYGKYDDLREKTDKYTVKQYINQTLGPQYIVPTLGVWTSVEEIEWGKMPQKFILKCTHDSGSVILCDNIDSFDTERACEKLNAALSHSFFYIGREPNYKGIVPRIIAEPYLEDNSGQLLDYKFFCFDGKAKLFKIDFNRFTYHQANYYNIDGKQLPLEEIVYPKDPALSNPYPEKIPEMVEISEKLSEGYPFMRIDLYCVDGNVLFGEMTPFPGSGFLKYAPDQWDTKMGDMLDLELYYPQAMSSVKEMISTLLRRSKYKLVRMIENDAGIHVFSDKTCVQSEYYPVFGKEINWKNPRTFNEKLQWLKFNDRRPNYSRLVDKYSVKEYIAEKIGDEYLIPTYGVWDNFSDIDFNSLPDQFVLKSTHDSGGLYICKSKEQFNIIQCRQIIEQSQKRNFFYVGREWVYKQVRPRIMAEEYIRDTEGEDHLTDYKIHCFNGEPKLILVCKNRFGQSGIEESFFNENWELLDVKRPGTPQCDPQPKKPQLLEEMLSIARKLSDTIPFVRVDLYVAEKRIYFGEMTFYPASGFVPFEPESYDRILGDWLKLDRE